MKSFDENDTSLTSEKMTESFLHAMSRGGDSLREEWLARETMLSLMRLVRSEQMLAIRRSVTRLVPEGPPLVMIKRPKAKRGSRKQPGQTQLVFGREN